MGQPTTWQLLLEAQAASGWAVQVASAVNTVATISKAGVAGTRHVATTITACLVGHTAAPAATGQLNVVLRDGATGVGAVLWAGTLSIPAVAGECRVFTVSGLFIIGTAGNAMTLEFQTAGGANTFETVSLTGFDLA
jgi:hypothetical protein